jgi:hypothetical protein
MAAVKRNGARRSRSLNGYRWESLDEDGLLNLPLRRLHLRLEDSLAAPEIEQLYAELERRDIRYRPHFWISSEWFSPDGIPGIAIPFFVAHPRLRAIERRMMGQIEGGTAKWRLRILRHEAGHAIDTAYGLRRRADWRAVFGYASKPYPKDYSVRPGSDRYVLHLGHWYAQSHPTEDFAETFAVWLQPKARWRRDYAGWHALKKLEFVDGLMKEIAGKPPRKRDRSIVAPLSDMSETIGQHYRRLQRGYESAPWRYDDWLRRTFTSRSARPRAVRASRFIRESAPILKRRLVRHLAINPYIADHVIERLRYRVRELDLVLRGPRKESGRPVVRLLERISFDLLRRNRENYLL